MFSSFSKIPRWRKKFHAAYPFFDNSPAEPERLRLILGVGRSGTSWVCQVLFKSQSPMRCFSEPLFHIQPPLPFHAKGDHTATEYEAIPADHPLAAAYQLLAHRQFTGTQVKSLERNDAKWETCLVKEVHSLLGVEGLLKLWQTPMIFILRDPIYIIDSLFAAQTLETIYLDHEVEAVQQDAFLNRFFHSSAAVIRQLFADLKSRDSRERCLLQKLLCVQLMQEMLTRLAVDYSSAKVVPYEDLCAAPQNMFRVAAAALGLKWDEAMEGYLTQTTAADSTSSDPYSIKRNTAEQKSRPFKFLTAEEVTKSHALIEAVKASHTP